MTVKQWDNETENTPVVNVYLYRPENGGDSYWVVEVDTNDSSDTTRVYVNDELVKG